MKDIDKILAATKTKAQGWLQNPLALPFEVMCLP